MFKRASIAVCVLLTASLAMASASWAGFRVCNHTPQRIDVAFGYPHQQFGWTSEGWWTIHPGQCRQVMRGNLTNRYYYLYAIGSQGSVWEAPAGQASGFFCIRPGRFVFHNSNYENNGVLTCTGAQVGAKQFFQVDTGGAPNHIHNLSQ